MLWSQKADDNATQSHFPKISSLFTRRNKRGKVDKVAVLRNLELNSTNNHVVEHDDRKPKPSNDVLVDVRQLDLPDLLSDLPTPTSFISSAESVQSDSTRRQDDYHLGLRGHRASVISTSSSVGRYTLSTKATSTDLNDGSIEPLALKQSREAHAVMLAAFDAALKKKDKMKSLDALPKGVPEKRSSSCSALPKENMFSRMPAQPLVTTPLKRPGMRRERSLSMRLLSQHSKVTNSRQYFSTMPLPPLPTGDLTAAWRKYNFHPRAKQIKRTLLYTKTTQPNAEGNDQAPYRRASCPHIHSTIEIAKPEAPVNPDEDLLFAAGCTVRWLFNGSRFCDPKTSVILKRPGASCLSLEHSVIDFHRDFPSATQEIFAGSSTAGEPADQPKFASLPYEDNSFDVISGRTLTTSILSRHWPTTLAELRRVLRPGGRIELFDISTEWLNPGPLTTAYGVSLGDAFKKRGLMSDILSELPRMVNQSELEGVKVAYLAVPVHWGGSVSRLWVHNIEPHSTAYEAALLGQSIESRHKQWTELETEIVTHRSAKVIMTISATK